MEKFLSAVKSSQLFAGIDDEGIRAMLSCLLAEKRSYKKGETVLSSGVSVDCIGLVLSGSVNVIEEDYWGNRNIVTVVGPGQSFAESYACAGGASLEVRVEAAQDCNALFMNIRRILTTCTSACAFHTRLIQNLVSLLAYKNLLMNQKLTHMAQRSTREKLLSYLSAESAKRGSASFDIPLNRQQLADYLSVDRSAMSNELSKMSGEGILRFRKNHFTLLQTGIAQK